MFGTLGVPELVLIFIVALLLFGPRKMPQIGRSVGRALSEFRRASNEFKRTIEDEVAAEEIREVERDIRDVKTVGRDLVDDVTHGSDAKGVEEVKDTAGAAGAQVAAEAGSGEARDTV